MLNLQERGFRGREGLSCSRRGTLMEQGEDAGSSCKDGGQQRPQPRPLSSCSGSSSSSVHGVQTGEDGALT